MREKKEEDLNNKHDLQKTKFFKQSNIEIILIRKNIKSFNGAIPVRANFLRSLKGTLNVIQISKITFLYYNKKNKLYMIV